MSQPCGVRRSCATGAVFPYRRSILTPGWGWQKGRMPGRGEVDWGLFVGALRDVGFDGTISVEHEDDDFEGSGELVERGFLVARETLALLLT